MVCYVTGYRRFLTKVKITLYPICPILGFIYVLSQATRVSIYLVYCIPEVTYASLGVTYALGEVTRALLYLV